MQVLVSNNTTNKLLRDFKNQWLDVDTSFLSDNQYNVMVPGTDNEIRVFDGDIAKIKDDARKNTGLCIFCGKVVHDRREAESHFLDRESRRCNLVTAETNCAYKHRVSDDSKFDIKEKGYYDGQMHYMRIDKEVYHYECNYPKEHDGRPCIHDECRRSGIKWFTEDNTFFLKYPDGFEQGFVDFSKLNSAEWDFRGHMGNELRYKKRFGSYDFMIRLECPDNGTEIDPMHDERAKVRHLVLWNCDTTRRFCVDPNDMTVIVYDGINASPTLHERVFYDKSTNAAASAEKKAIKLLLSLLM